jgi:hypothetical protein
MDGHYRPGPSAAIHRLRRNREKVRKKARASGGPAPVFSIVLVATALLAGVGGPEDQGGKGSTRQFR